MSTAVQVPDSYWVVPRRLLAGAYPGARDAADAEARVARFLEAGVTMFVDLTEAGELAPYALLLPDGVRTIRKAVQDFSCPRPGEMDRILDLIDAELESGETVYVHCRGGLGRTGTVVGCWLVRHGMHGEQALEWIATVRRDAPGGARSPETDEQRRFILGWRDRARGSKGQVRTYVGDSTHGHPTTREQWETAIASVDEAMGLARVDGLAEVYLPAVTQAEFIGR